MIEYQNRWFYVERNGNYYYINEPASRQGAAILPLINGKIWLLAMQRPAQKGDITLEIPRGYAEPNETAQQCALRELKEETGICTEPNRLFPMGWIRPNTALLTARIRLFLFNLTEDAICAQRDDEATSIRKFPLEELPNIIAKGFIEDSFTLVALSYYWSLHGAQIR